MVCTGTWPNLYLGGSASLLLRDFSPRGIRFACKISTGPPSPRQRDWHGVTQQGRSVDSQGYSEEGFLYGKRDSLDTGKVDTTETLTVDFEVTCSSPVIYVVGGVARNGN